MVLKQRGGYLGAITKLETFIQACSEQQFVATTRSALESSLNTLASTRAKYMEVQEQVIAQQELESHRQREEEALSSVLERCDALEIRIRDLIDQIPENPLDTSMDEMKTWMQERLEAQLKEQERRHLQEINKMSQKIASLSAQAQDGPPKQEFSNECNSELSKLVNLLAEKLNVTPHTSKKDTHLKLPEMNLPPFSGKLSEWMPFKDQFTSSIINHPDLYPVQKLQYLRSALSGEAFSLIKNLPTTAANFDVAWRILEERYNKKYNIIMDHISTFFNVPSVTTFNLQSFSQLCAKTSASVMGVKAMGVEQFDLWLIFHVLQKLDNETKLLWRQECRDEIPTWDKFSAFLFKRRDDVESCGISRLPTTPNPTKTNSHKKTASALVATNLEPCKCCNESPHALFRCPKFIAMSPDERYQTVVQLNLCRNCITSKHLTSQCTFRTCRKCNSRHNVLLHERFTSYSGNSTSNSNQQTNSSNPGPFQRNPVPTTTPTNSQALPAIVNISQPVNAVRQSPRIFLATAVVDVLDRNGRKIQCRALLDSGAQTNLMSANLMQKLKLPKQSANVFIVGVGAHRSSTSEMAVATVKSRVSSSFYNLQCLIVPKITGDIPNWPVNRDSFPIPSGITLADPEWYEQRPVDLLIGGESYWDIVLDGSIDMGDGMPKLKPTTFGHVLVGKQSSSDALCHVSVLENLDQTLKRFWEVEDIPNESPVSDQHREAETHFKNTYSRTPEGRFLVKLPFRKDSEGQTPVLGHSRSTSVRQLFALERRFERNPLLKLHYIDVMRDYLTQGWLEPVPEKELRNYSYYMPHHGVLKESTSTRLRVVYNASSKTSNGLSLNDILLVGPTVHPDLFIVLLRFRHHQYAVMADITKMYLQLVLHPDHADFQRLVWREDPSEPVRDYRITRVCFGVTSSPFLATRALVELAHEHKHSHPLASEIILNSFYVDDCIFSSESLIKAKETQSQLMEVMARGGFVLAKWVSNHPGIQPTGASESNTALIQDSTKALGLRWDAESDTFHFISPISTDVERVTKRSVASAIAKIFDPLGLIGPVIAVAKMILQELHKLEVDWEDEVSGDCLNQWQSFVGSIQDLQAISIPRWISQFPTPSCLELHGFCDASTKAYGAVVYVVTQDELGNRYSSLLTSKSRVAPQKNPQTIPRLELCGALLLTNLMEKVKEIFAPAAIYLWTDSTIVLSWLNSPPDSYKKFVANRIGNILKLTPAFQWKHVPTLDNPADLISRGASPSQLSASTLWWHGPPWLKCDESEWPQIPPNCIRHVPDDAKASVNFFSTWMEEVSSLKKLQFRMAFVLRFIYNCLHPESKRTGKFSVEELERALRKLIYLDQHERFPQVIRQLHTGRGIMAPWKFLQSLSPYLDLEGLVRVGGRLEKSHEAFGTKHPILLPKSTLQELIAQREHLRQMHAAPSLLLASLRQNYWPISGRNLARKIVRSCITCVRARPKPLEQIMGDLPAHRVTYERPFYATAVDYAGPLTYKLSNVKKAKTAKAYICLFVCLSVKAIHLELVTDLTTEAFLAAFRRFVSRRSAPRHMYSDCGTNFVGASRELCKLHSNHDAIADATSEIGIVWHFNPPGAPHQGGLWEAGVKSVKFHLNRTLGQTLNTYEEIVTILYQIEAILNSRPLCLASEDPSETDYLTPGHFLVGAPLNVLPDPDLSHINPNHLGRWQYCQERTQHFAYRWKREYLNTLQQRMKWKNPHPNVDVGDVVLTLEDVTGKWILGRIAAVHSGADGHVRVVTIRTSKGVFKRPITKVAFLPVKEQSGPTPILGEDVHAATE